MNTFGERFRLTTFGESHGLMVGGVIDGCPSGMILDMNRLQEQLRLRAPQSVFGATSREESDEVVFLSGLMEGITTGTPLAFVVENHNVRSADYESLRSVFRPGHADYTYQMKYGIRDHRGGGRASARETVVRVVAGAVARQWLESQGVIVEAYVSRIGSVGLEGEYYDYDLSSVHNSPLRCPDLGTESRMKAVVETEKAKGDSIGGEVTCVVRGIPVGIGNPLYDRLDARLAYAMLSIPASKSFEIGERGAYRYRGSEYNDPMSVRNDRVCFETNHAGGVLGGISNGEDVFFRVGFKPTSSISILQKSVSTDLLHNVDLEIHGRHDTCIVPRAVAVVEAMAAMVVMDLML